MNVFRINAARITTHTTDEMRALLEQKGVGQREAANLIGMDDRQLRRMLSGDEPMPVLVWMALNAMPEKTKTQTA